ncbi:hypothetical protein Daesc_005369 [Daldinia eschscholtzii]|uniref:Ankyrin n=1 Tax=Daldinia eschscholtzii TaxID=292717 RepID=A0AAX6MKB9_9PEZI
MSLNENTIRAAVYSGSIDRFTTLLSEDPKIINYQFDRRGTPLALACQSQQPARIQTKIPTLHHFPLASVAAFYNDTSAAKLLLQHGAKLEHSGALAAAAGRGNETMVRYLLENGAQQDKDVVEGRIPEHALHIAARKGYVGIVKLLLEHGAELGQKDANGRTALEVVKEVEEKDGTDLSEIRNLLTKH